MLSQHDSHRRGLSSGSMLALVVLLGLIAAGVVALLHSPSTDSDTQPKIEHPSGAATPPPAQDNPHAPPWHRHGMPNPP